MVVYGYARVSTIGQTLAAQESALYEAGAVKVFKEKISGAANHRAQLHRLLKTIDAGDLVIVTRLDRLARSTRLGTFRRNMSRRRLCRSERTLLIPPRAYGAGSNRWSGARSAADHRFFFFSPKIRFQLSFLAWVTGFWPSPL